MNHMVQKKSSQPRGRPHSYDLDDVVSRATAVFWAEGLEATSVDDLEHATGLNRSSIYTALDGKHGLFRRCLRNYVDTAERELLEPALHGTAGLDDLDALVARVAGMLDSSEHPPGCFAIRSLLRGDDGEFAERYVAALRAAIAATLQRAVTIDNLDSVLTSSRAALVEAALLGMLALGRAPAHDPLPLAEGLRVQVAAWRAPSATSAPR